MFFTACRRAEEMVDAQNAQHQDSMDVDNDSEPALADPDATMY